MKKNFNLGYSNVTLSETFNFHMHNNKTISIDKPLEITLESINLRRIEVILTEKLSLSSTVSINIFVDGDNYIVVGSIAKIKKKSYGFLYTIEVIYLSEDLKYILEDLIHSKNSFYN